MSTGKPIRQVAPPALPQAPSAYSRTFQDQNNSVLRLYFNQLNNVANSLISPSSGGAALFLPHGSFRSDQDQTVSSINTATLMSFPEVFSASEVLGVHINGGANTDIQVDFNGVYHISINLQVGSANNTSKDITVWLRRNGTDIPNSGRRSTIGKTGGTVVSYSVTVELKETDVLQVVWATNNTGLSLSSTAASAPYPAIPSAIISITHQSNVRLD